MESLTKALASQYPGEKSDRSEAEMSHVLTQLCVWLVRSEIRFWLIKRSIYITKQTKFGRRDLARRVRSFGVKNGQRRRDPNYGH